MFMSATEIAPRTQDIAQLVLERMLFVEDLTVVFPAGLCVVVPTGLLHRSPWQHSISQLVISAPYASVAFFKAFVMVAHVIFFFKSSHVIFEEHSREWTTTLPINGALPVIVIVTQESCPGSLHSMVTSGLPHMVPMPSKALGSLMLLIFSEH